MKLPLWFSRLAIAGADCHLVSHIKQADAKHRNSLLSCVVDLCRGATALFRARLLRFLSVYVLSSVLFSLFYQILCSSFFKCVTSARQIGFEHARRGGSVFRETVGA